MSSPGTQNGITLVEIMIGVVIFVGGILTLGSVVQSTREVANDTRAEARVAGEHRRNLDALANVLRTVAPDTLAGFDASGVSSNLTFSRVVGADMGGIVLSSTEELRWIASTQAVNGVEEPGAVFLISDGVQTLIADRVPKGGFLVRREGDVVGVELTTYYITREGRSVVTNERTSVSLRN